MPGQVWIDGPVLKLPAQGMLLSVGLSLWNNPTQLVRVILIAAVHGYAVVSLDHVERDVSQNTIKDKNVREAYVFEGQNLLIIDDEPVNLNIASGYLQRNGLEVLMASGGEEGIGIARERQPDLILLDVMMPGVDGFETCHRLKKDPTTQDIPILFLSSLTDLDDKLKGFALGGLDYIAKPIEEAELLARVSTHLHIRRLQQELEEKNARLSTALDTGNVVNVAIGALMERHRLSREDAFQQIRMKARSERRKVQAVAEELLDGLNSMNLWQEVKAGKG